MTKLILDRHGKKTAEPSEDLLRSMMFSYEYWGTRSDTAVLEYDGTKKCLIICFHKEHGFELKYYDDNDEESVSLEDNDKLKIIIKHCGDGDGDVSLGLFVSPEKAWLVVKEFCLSGQKSDKIKWVDWDEMPEEGRW